MASDGNAALSKQQVEMASKEGEKGKVGWRSTLKVFKRTLSAVQVKKHYQGMLEGFHTFSGHMRGAASAKCLKYVKWEVFANVIECTLLGSDISRPSLCKPGSHFLEQVSVQKLRKKRFVWVCLFFFVGFFLLFFHYE